MDEQTQQEKDPLGGWTPEEIEIDPVTVDSLSTVSNLQNNKEL
jgi:hypothetical protein